MAVKKLNEDRKFKFGDGSFMISSNGPKIYKDILNFLKSNGYFIVDTERDSVQDYVNYVRNSPMGLNGVANSYINFNTIDNPFSDSDESEVTIYIFDVYNYDVYWAPTVEIENNSNIDEDLFGDIFNSIKRIAKKYNYEVYRV